MFISSRQIEDFMKTFFTADTHFSHANIIKYCQRPFTDSLAMNEALIENWNAVVGKRDLVFHLGDFMFGKRDADFDAIFSRPNGTIVLIKGNHDKIAWANRNKFYAAHDSYHETSVNGQTIILCHYAMRVWKGSHRGTWHLYGHSHGSLADLPDARCFDIGVDCHNFRPLEFGEIEARMSKKTFRPVDHHE